jgi:hypothetical protein
MEEALLPLDTLVESLLLFSVDEPVGEERVAPCRAEPG